MQACIRETGDRFDFGQTQECHIIQVARDAIGAGFCSLLGMGNFSWWVARMKSDDHPSSGETGWKWLHFQLGHQTCFTSAIVE
jgi:hypothetical protein